MAKTKTPRTTSSRSKKNGAETIPSETTAVEAGTSESVALKAPVATPDFPPVVAPTSAAKPEFWPLEVKSESTRKPILEHRRGVVPINLEEEIRRRAYQLYEERGCTPGHENDDWLVAEREVLTRYTAQQHSA